MKFNRHFLEYYVLDYYVSVGLASVETSIIPLTRAAYATQPLPQGAR